MRTPRLVLLLAGTLLLVAPGAATAQEGSVNFVVEPVPGSSTAPRGGYFLLQATRGDAVTQAIGVRNDSPDRLELRLAAVDAVTGQRGGASYTLDTETPTRTGAWITLERTSLTLDPKASTIVPFRVAVPRDAASGEHLAGVSVAAPTEQRGPGPTGEGQAGATVDVQARRIIAVQINLPGPSDPELVVTGVTPAGRPDGLYLEIGIENAGRGLTAGEGTITLPDRDFEQSFTVDTFVPGTSIAYPIKWTEAADDGDYPARVEIRYGERVARWNGTFTVGEAVREELAERRVETPEQRNNDGGGISAAALAVAMLAGGVLTAAAAIAVIRFRRPGGHRPRGPQADL
jgi:hypothetical protein